MLFFNNVSVFPPIFRSDGKSLSFKSTYYGGEYMQKSIKSKELLLSSFTEILRYTTFK